MTRHLFIINGKSGSGKDEFVKYLFEALGPYWHRANISSITPVYEKLQEMGISMMPKTPETRQLAADMKKVLNGYNRWADLLAMNAVQKAYNDGADSIYHTIVFLHVRESVSIDHIVHRMPFNWKVSTLWVERPDVPTVANDEAYNDQLYDFLITNGGTLEELKAQAVEFAKKFED